MLKNLIERFFNIDNINMNELSNLCSYCLKNPRNPFPETLSGNPFPHPSGVLASLSGTFSGGKGCQDSGHVGNVDKKRSTKAIN